MKTNGVERFKLSIQFKTAYFSIPYLSTPNLSVAQASHRKRRQWSNHYTCSTSLVRLLAPSPLLTELSMPPVIHDGAINSINSRSSQPDRRVLPGRSFYIIAYCLLTSKAIDNALRDDADASRTTCLLTKKVGWLITIITPRAGVSLLKISSTISPRSVYMIESTTFVWLDIKSPDWCQSSVRENPDEGHHMGTMICHTTPSIHHVLCIFFSQSV